MSPNNASVPQISADERVLRHCPPILCSREATPRR